MKLKEDDNASEIRFIHIMVSGDLKATDENEAEASFLTPTHKLTFPSLPESSH